MQTVHLYTRQHENSFYELQNKGRITNKRQYVELHMRDISEYFLEKYDRFVQMAEAIIPRPDNICYPIWTSISQAFCLKPIEKEIVYCLEVPADQVIYFDGVKWDYVLNGLYIPKDPTDEAAFQVKLKHYGIASQHYLIHGKLRGMYPDLERQIKDSWSRIFDVETWSPFNVQANLWEIRSEWVKHIVRPGEDLFTIAADMAESDHEAVYRAQRAAREQA